MVPRAAAARLRILFASVGAGILLIAGCTATSRQDEGDASVKAGARAEGLEKVQSVRVAGSVGRCSIPAKAVVRVRKNGEYYAGGEKYDPRELADYLHRVVAGAPRETDTGLSAVLVEIQAEADCPYRHIQRATVQCVREFIWRVSWRIGEERLDAKLHVGIGDGPFDTESKSAAALKGPRNIKIRTGRLGKACFTVDGSALADAALLPRLMKEATNLYPRTTVVIDAAGDVDFRWVFCALDACLQANIKDVRLVPPPAPAGVEDRP